MYLWARYILYILKTTNEQHYSAVFALRLSNMGANKKLVKKMATF